MDELVFLGTGGGRYNTLFQKRSTGGLIYKTCSHQLHIDPGPGALLRCKECNVYPFETDVLIATHHHIDHVNDLNLMIEGATHATKKKRGTLIVPKVIIDEKTVTDYHKSLLDEIIVLKAGQNTAVNGLRIQAVKCKHREPNGIGYKFYTPEYCLYYTGDTIVYPGFERNLKDVDVLIANTILPGNENLGYHLCTNDLISVIKNSKHNLKLIITNHFGLKMLRTGPEKEASKIMKETGVKTIAATDSLIIKIDNELIGKKSK
jgi:phosphoribosyl 1,2-cyclic phosphodiesterase